MTSTNETEMMLPHWDMTPYFPGLESPEFTGAFASTKRSVTEFVEAFSGIAAEQDTTAALEDLLRRQNVLAEEMGLISAYISSFVAIDTGNAVAQALLSELKLCFVLIDQVEARIAAWIGGLDLESAITSSPLCADHAFILRKTQKSAQYLMSGVEEDLTAALRPSASSAWSKLHGDITSQILVPFERDGVTAELPMSAIRNLARDVDPDVRKRAYEAELKSWQLWRVPIAAALNGIKGEVDIVSRRRHWGSPIEEALFSNNTEQAALDAMLCAARESFPDFRRYFHAKARLLGTEKLAWYDLFAPVAVSEHCWSWDEARDFLIENFGAYSAKLSDFAARAFREKWIDAEPRQGKVGGAFCMEVTRDESRILANYDPSFDSVSTLAHELGHGYHNLCLATQHPHLRRSPMTLAETASIFCETIVRNAAVQSASETEKLIILEGALQGSSQVVVDITSRFLFETDVFEARQKRELSPDEFSGLMLKAQQDTYGDGLDPAIRHPYMWAVKGHYYSSYSYYNYPYMFGLLFGLGLYARFEVDPDWFRARYDDLLASTGKADAATLAHRFDIDICSPDFWRGSLSVVKKDVDLFEDIVNRKS